MACVVCWEQMLLKSSLKYLRKRLGNFAKESTFCIFDFRVIECFCYNGVCLSFDLYFKPWLWIRVLYSHCF